MPFGAEALPGGVRFQLWAPGAERVELLLGTGREQRSERLERAADGWHRAEIADAGPGTRYQYRLPDGLAFPDPASRFNPEDVHAPSEVIDPAAYAWRDEGWRGRPWNEAVIYETHVGCFSSRGTYEGIEERLDYLLGLGVTAIELMPLADFPGARGWGYDGVLAFAPESTYGRPEALKRLIDAAHERGLMMLLDVVYNHFGPDGNYLHAYAPQFFTDRHETPWGKAMNFDSDGAAVVRQFFIHNALYWLEEYHFDGLRFDAVHAIRDESAPDLLTELARAVHEGPGRERHVHLVLENDLNAAHRLERTAERLPRYFTAQWNDDFHHAAHVMLTGERDGYYGDYPEDSARLLGRCLAEGFAYQGDPSPFRDQERRGEPSAHLPPGAFVDFLQNHDQVGNRAYGERISRLSSEQALRTLTTILLLAPSPPLLFMGDEFAAASPFLFFCDFTGELAKQTREGRRREFARFESFRDPAVAASIPDPLAVDTFKASRLDWSELETARGRRWLALHRTLLDARRKAIAPLIPRLRDARHAHDPAAPRRLDVEWRLEGGGALRLRASLGDADARLEAAHGTILHREAGDDGNGWWATWELLP
jgi:malto-oligosyltrehalose trehalohydrolase